MTDLWTAYWTGSAAAVGLAIGSFLNVCVARWPAGESVVAPRSRCPRCGRPIAWTENIPVVSWLMLRGRCAGCRGRISVQYPLVELLVGALWAGAAWVAGPTLTGLRLAVLGTLLVGIFLTDLQAYEIPDGFTVPGLAVGLLGAFASAFTPDGGWPFATFPDALVGACAGAGAIAIAGWLGEAMLKREAMGFGDVTLMAMVGAHLGPTRALVTVALGAGLGAVLGLALLPFRRRDATPADDDAVPSGAFGLPALPFGVALVPATVLMLLWGDGLIAWYLTRFGPS